MWGELQDINDIVIALEIPNTLNQSFEIPNVQHDTWMKLGEQISENKLEHNSSTENVHMRGHNFKFDIHVRHSLLKYGIFA